MQTATMELKKLNEELMQQLRALQIENKLLHEKVQFLLKQMFGRKTEKLDPRQLLLLLQGMEVVETPPEDDPPPPPPHPPRAPRKNNKPRIPENLPVEEEIIIPAEVEANPQNYKCIGEETTKELDVDPARYYVRHIIRRRFVRKDQPELAPVIAPLKPRLIEGGYASVGLLTDIILKKFVDHLPLYRQERILKTRHEIDLSRKTMCDWMGKTADWFTPIYNHMRDDLIRSRYLQIDETPIRYCREDKGGSGQGYLWVYHHPGGDVLFEWHTSRGADCLEKMLHDFRGTAQTDGYASYSAYARKHGGIILAGCWAHARRKIFEAQEEAPVVAGWLLNQIGHLYRLESEFRKSHAGARLRQALRAASSRMILARIKKALGRKMPEYLPQSRMGKAIGYALSHWKQLEQFCDDGRIEIDNNLVENAIRPTALGKKNWLFFGSPDAGQRSAIIYTLLESCRRRGINQREYLLDVLSRLPSMKITEVAELTPARWLAARKAAQNQVA